jgi:hypothetical protein
MLVGKIIIQLLTAILSAFAIYSYFHKIDRRTLFSKKTEKWFYFLIGTLVTVSIILEITNFNQTIEGERLFTYKVDSLTHNLDSIKTRSDKSLIQLTIVIDNLDSLNKRIEPFLLLATKKYPKINADSALRRLYASFLVQGDYISSSNQSGGITAKTVAPDAIIFTQNQIGDNTVVNPTVNLPPPNFKAEWTVRNKFVKAIETNARPPKSISIPTENYPFNELYHNRFTIEYSSIVTREVIAFYLKRTDVVFASVNLFASGQLHWGVALNDKLNSNFCVLRIGQPQSNKYLVDFYSKEIIWQGDFDFAYQK